jgi:DNA primase small subunit
MIELNSEGRREIADYVKIRGGIEIDTPVTVDIHRLIRVPGGLHGGTGFLVKKIGQGDLDKFDPFSDAQVFAGRKEVYVTDPPIFRMGDTIYEDLQNQERELPMNVAIFLLCKGRAQLKKKGED